MARFGRSQPLNFYYSDNQSVGNAVDLAGTGAAASQGTADLAVSLSLTGSGAASDGSRADLVPVPPVPGYTNWYDAADTSSVTTVDDDLRDVTQWVDKTDSSENLFFPNTAISQPTTGTRTINGLNVIDFQGGQYLAATGIPLAGNTCTLFAVVQKDSGSRLITFTDGSQNDFDNTAGFAYVDVLDDGTVYDAAFVVSGDGVHAVFDTSTPTLYTVQRNVTAWSGRANGVNLTGGTSVDTSFNASNLGVGAYPTGQSPASGAVGEIIIYDRVLTAPEILLVETYLTAKWFPAAPVQITGTGTNAGQGRADLTVTQNLTGTGTAAATSPNAKLVLAASLTGTGTAADGGQAPLKLSASLTGHGDVAAAGPGVFTATVNNFIDFAARGAAAAAGPGSFVLAADLEGSGTTAAASRADLISTASLSGTGAVAAASQASLKLAASLAGSGANAAQARDFQLDNKVNLGIARAGGAAGTNADLVLTVDLEGAGTAAALTKNIGMNLAAGLSGAGAASSAGISSGMLFAWALSGFGAGSPSSQALLQLVMIIAGRSAAASGGRILGFPPDPTPLKDTIWDRGHTTTIVELR